MDFTVNLNELEITAILECPYCGKGKVYVYKGSKGANSSGCSKCRRIVLWDFDNYKAYKATAKKFAS